MQHVDPRTTAQPQFPPPGFSAQPVPHHLAPEHSEAPPAQPETPFFATPGQGGEEPEYGDYFGFDERHRYIFPDGKQWIEFRVFTEGDLARYQRMLNRDVMVEKTTGNARIKINQVEERHALLRVAVTNWNMMKRTTRGWQQEPFNDRENGTFHQWLNKANPSIIADLEKAVRDKNPFLLAASAETVEAIDKQIEDLEVQRAQIIERMQGEGVSATS